MTDLNSSLNTSQVSGMGMGLGSTSAAYNFNRNQYQQQMRQQQQRGSANAAGINNNHTSSNNLRFSNNPTNLAQNKNFGPSMNKMSSNPRINQVGAINIPQSSQQGDRPYMMFVYSQKFTVAGQGEYEIKITNVINPYTMKATPLQPSLIDPTYMMAQGIGNSKKNLAITSDQLPQLIMQQNHVKRQRHGSSDSRDKRKRQQNLGQQATSSRIQNNQLATRSGNNTGRNKFSGGAQVRMLACSKLYKQAAQTVTLTKNYRKNPAIKHVSEDEIRIKRMELGAKLFKKIMNNKLRAEFREIKTKSWQVYKFREQQKKKRGLQLFKFMVFLKDKQKNHKFFALSKLKENHLSQIQERSGGQDSQSSNQNSKSNSQYYLKNLNPQDNYISPTPTTASQSYIAQQAPKVSTEKQKAIKVITYYMERMVKDNQFAFWLPFRALQKKTNAYVKELKIDYGSQRFDREQLEQELAMRFNKIEIKKVLPADSQKNQRQSNDDEDPQQLNYKQTRNQQLFGFDDDTIDFGDTSKIIDANFANVSAIQPHLFTQHSRFEETFIDELQQFNNQRSRINSRHSIEQPKMRTGDIQNFSPIFYDQAFNNSPQKQNKNDPLDASSFIVMEDDVKAIKIENNLANLNKDIMLVNDEIEQIKKLLFTTQNDEVDDDIFEFEPNNQMPQKRQLEYRHYQNNAAGTSPDQNNDISWMDDSMIEDLDPIYSDANLVRTSALNNSQIIEIKNLPLKNKRQLVPVSRINNKFRTEEEMIEYYELKALDHIDENYANNTKNRPSKIEEAKYEEEIEHLLAGQMKKQSSMVPQKGRDRADSIKKNIQKYEKTRRKNLNDSREHDFDGFDEFCFQGNQRDDEDFQ